jgi:hypothetical protein
MSASDPKRTFTAGRKSQKIGGKEQVAVAADALDQCGERVLGKPSGGDDVR